MRTSGIKGPRCVDVAEAIAQIVGREESRQLTDEYFEAAIRVHGQVEQRVRRAVIESQGRSSHAMPELPSFRTCPASSRAAGAERH